MSSIFLPVSFPVVGSMWQPAQRSAPYFFPRATRSGVTGTLSASFPGAYFGIPVIATYAANAPTATPARSRVSPTIFQTFRIQRLLSIRKGGYSNCAAGRSRRQVVYGPNRFRTSAVARGEGSALALRAHGPPLPRDRRARRGGARSR